MHVSKIETMDECSTFVYHIFRTSLPLPRNPGLLISYTRFGQVDYRGTFFISDTGDDDFAGIVFGYQSNR